VRYYLLLILVTLASFSVGALLTSAATAILWRRLAKPIDRLSAARRARWLLSIRVAPTVVGGFLSLVLGVTFLEFEPRDTREDAGALLALLAALAVLLVLVACARLVRLIGSDSTLWRLMGQCRQWRVRDGGTVAVLDTAYPVAAVAGVFHPRLLLSARVLRECTPDEIDTIVAHERAHMRRRDNLARALLRALPDRWLAPRVNDDIERAWTRAAEEAADGEAAGRAGAPRAALAATLIRVAGMADEAPPAWMPQLAFYQGTDLEYRVRTLLAAPRLDSARVVVGEAAAFALAVSLLVVAFASTAFLHRVMELGVALLP
jgi:Zn-dependent protease with chaperone function